MKLQPLPDPAIPACVEVGEGRAERIEGSSANVVGLPMELVDSMLGEWGIEPRLSGREAD